MNKIFDLNEFPKNCYIFFHHYNIIQKFFWIYNITCNVFYIKCYLHISEYIVQYTI